MQINRKAIKANAKLAMKQAKPSIFLVTLVYLLIIFVLEVLSLKVSGEFDNIEKVFISAMQGKVYVSNSVSKIVPLASLISLAISIMSVMITTGFAIYCLNVSRQIKASYGHLFDAFGIFFRVLWLHILMFSFITLWTMLFIIPGIIAAYRYRMALFILIDNPRKTALECITESKNLMVGHKLELFVLDLSFIGWVYLCIIPFVAIWVTPYIQVTEVNFYNALINMPQTHNYHSDNNNQDNGGGKPPWEY